MQALANCCRFSSRVARGIMSPTRDIVSRETRARMMRSVRQRGTTPELVVRDLLIGLGAKYRLNNRNLPGSPDFSNQSQGWAVFVNGCFWHGHRNCQKTKGGKNPRIPATRSAFWSDKLTANRRRDARKCHELRALGLRVMIIWECQIRQSKLLRSRLSSLLGKATDT